MHDLDVVHGNLEIVSRCALFCAHHMFTFAPLQVNVLVDIDGTPCIGSSTAMPSLADWLKDLHGLTPSSAPELMNPGAFRPPKSRPTNASDIYAFGVLGYQVKRALTSIPTRRIKNVGCRS